VEFDRQRIERHDFPTARRGYDPAAVDAHLRALAEWTMELARQAAAGAEPSLGTAAATQVQRILEAAQATATEIARGAQRDAQRTREEAALEVERARAHVETLARAATALLAQVQSLDGEVSALAQSLRAGREESGSEEDPSATRPAPTEVAEEHDPTSSALASPPVAAPAPTPRLASVPEPLPPLALAPEPTPELVYPPQAPPQPGASERGGEDLDGARLVALNMALSGEPREQTDRYLADSFQLADRAKLLDEVYAAIEG
jgi:DivIVA domain-containing protein